MIIMDDLKILCGTVKKIIKILKPENKAISFIVVIGKKKQGKTTFLRQSNLTHYPININNNADCFYNKHGIILELGEAWLWQSKYLLTHTLKSLNKHYCGITGMILCIDSSELLSSESEELLEKCRQHVQLAERFSKSLGKYISTAVVLTKVDVLAGFYEFFQTDHDLKKPLGFSLNTTKQRSKLVANYRQRFEEMLETLGQQIIHKLHPVRSSMRRTLIREFPSQLSSLCTPIQFIMQNLPLEYLQINAIYFISSEQGGLSLDKINKKIQQAYALTIENYYPQSNNYRAYFVKGALRAFQEQTKLNKQKMNSAQKWLLNIGVGIATLMIFVLLKFHYKTTQILDETGRELLLYQNLLPRKAQTDAIYHLTMANTKLQEVPTKFLLPSINFLKKQLKTKTTEHLINSFLPQLLKNLEIELAKSTKKPEELYQALKIYLMFAAPEYLNKTQVISWFNKNWQTVADKKHKLPLLKRILEEKIKPIEVNQQLVRDLRNQLNSLPEEYLFYLLAQNEFPQDKIFLTAEGFNLNHFPIPIYYTKKGFHDLLNKIPMISLKLQQENWVLARLDLRKLDLILEESYFTAYVYWWKNFLKKIRLEHYQNYQEGGVLTTKLQEKNSIANLVKFINENTSPEVLQNGAIFNQKIAKEFTNLNLINDLTLKELNLNLNELSKFLATLAVAHDSGQTAFNITKMHFQETNLVDPLSNIYKKARFLPEPISQWVKQLADDLWLNLITESKTFLNNIWQNTVFNEYITKIANRYPLAKKYTEEINLTDFDNFFAFDGTLNNFVKDYLKPFLDLSTAEWRPKEINGSIMPINSEVIIDLIRANVISNMFFKAKKNNSMIDFSLQKISLDPVVINLQLTIGNKTLVDNQDSESFTTFTWPLTNANLSLASIDGNKYDISETGPWAFFKILDKVNVIADREDSSRLQILFEINGNSGRYLLKTQNPINPFSPGILTDFKLAQNLTSMA